MEHSVTEWIADIKSGDQEAARLLWQRYFQRLIRLARKKIGGRPRRVADEEDAVAEAFNSLFRGAKENRFKKLEDRDDLWQLLVLITTRKVINQTNREMRQKRGGGRVRGESALDGSETHAEAFGIQRIMDGDPSPSQLVSLQELIQKMMDSLDDSLRSIAMLQLEGYKNHEIVEKLGAPRRTVDRKLRLIRDACEKLLQNES